MSSNVHIPFIKLTFGGVSLSWSYDSRSPDYFTSLSHKRYTDEANTMTINLTYCPKPGEDPNYVENAIVNSAGKCYIQYGDLSQGEISPQYKALVHSYKTDFVEGVLVYRLSLISSVVCYTYEKYPGKKFSKSKGDTVTMVESEIRRIVNDFMKVDGDMFRSYTYISSINFDDKLTFSTISVPEGNPIKALKSIVDQLKVRESWKSDKEVDQKVVQSVQDSIISNRHKDKTTLDPVKFEDLSGGVNRSLEYYLALEIDESGPGTGKVRVVLVSTDSPSATYTFNWGDRESEVISWSPEYDGAYSIFKSTGNKVFDTYLSNDSSGEFGYTTFSFSYPQVLENNVAISLLEQVENLKINASEVDRHYAYKATLTVRGKSKTMNLGQSVINVNPIVAGTYHHTAGSYVVIGVEDNVSSEGFTTTYTLYKSKSYDLYGNPSQGISIHHGGKTISIDDYDPESGAYSSNVHPLSDPSNRLSSNTSLGGSSGNTNYSDSPLASNYMWTKNYRDRGTSSNPSGSIDRISIHCMAGAMTAESCGSWFADPECGGSSHYGVGVDGSIGQYIPEKYRSICTSSTRNDSRAVTIEVSNDYGAGIHNGWYVNDVTLESTIKLVTDICLRNNIKELVYDPDDANRDTDSMKGNMSLHCWYANKDCPGQYLIDKHPWIAQEVNRRLNESRAFSGVYISRNNYLSESEMQQNARYIWSYFKPRGWTLNAVAGMLGNMETESTINPGIWQSLRSWGDPSGHGYGLVQWTPYTKYTQWCDERGLSIDHIDSALMRIEWELENGGQYYKTTDYPESFEEFKRSTKSAYYLGLAFLANYERPDNPNQPQRGDQATKWYNYLYNLDA